MNTSAKLTRNEFTLLYAVKRHGACSRRRLRDITGLSLGYVSQTMELFKKNGLTDDHGITNKGVKTLNPYKVNNALIMAAGAGTSLFPNSFDLPTGLFNVKGEVLIERQIRQLMEAGIREIIIVVGYKKEAFFYLESKFEGIKFIINPEFNIKGNAHTVYLAKEYLKNSYICSSDDYFAENPFEEYVYQSYYAGVRVSDRTREWYMIPDRRMNIGKITKTGEEGLVMLGQAYWDIELSSAMKGILEEDQEVGNYYQSLWEQILVDNIKNLPPVFIKEYPASMIFEFDTFDDLKRFDSEYAKRQRDSMAANISGTLDCRPEDIANLQIIKDGITNTTFSFDVNGRRYAYRHPKEESKTLISRSHECKALIAARSVGADPTFIFMDEKQGWKISTFVEDARIPDYGSFEDSKRILSVLRMLHQSRLSVDWTFLPWDEACRIETVLRSGRSGISDPEFDLLKSNVKKCYERCQDDGVESCFCHCDTYADNWLLTRDKTVLIDWEYAGNADPGCDIGAYIMDSMWQIPEAQRFIEEYCGKDMTKTLLFHYLAYTAIVSFYWYVWALYRESRDAVMGESLYNWRVMARRYSDHLIKEFKL